MSVSALTSRERLFLLVAAAALFGYVLLANSWVNDDAYITFRVIDNWFHGHGLRWNIVERVQVYTHPLWMFLLSGAFMFTRELFYTSLVVSFALAFIALGLARRALVVDGQAGVLLGLLLSSKAFIDYTSSGLENPLTYALYAWFALVYFRDGERRADSLRAGAHHDRERRAADHHGERRDGDVGDLKTLGRLTLIAALVFVNRIDALLPLLPALLHAAWRTWRAHGPRVLRPLLIGSLPAVAWLLFAIVYYGFPFPNTYYAKIATGLPLAIRLQLGLAFLTNSLRFDPLTLLVITTAAVWTIAAGAGLRALGAGLLLNLAYILWVGGDYMSGRFLSALFLLGALLFARALASGTGVGVLVAALAFYNVVWPNVPLKTTAGYEMAWPGTTQNGIKDERGGYHRATNVLFFAPFARQPDFPFVRDGQSLRYNPGRAFERRMIGLVGYYAGPDKYIIDINGLGDPLMARLPVDESIYFDFWTSHYFRPMPEGYLQSRETGQNRLRDPLIRDYFDRLTRVTSGPIWSIDRLAEIVRLNVGSDRHFSDRVIAARPVDVSARADNARFPTDIGIVGDDRLLRSAGEAGFLQLGPSIPLRAGRYEAEWHGALDGSPREEFGFVVACYDDCRRELARAPVLRGSLRPEASDLLATLRFRVPDGVNDLEYRFFVHDNVKMSLSRIALKSVVASDGGSR